MISSKKIIFTGGHHTSALAVAKELRKRGYKIYWLGHKHSMKSDRHLSLEYREVTQAAIDFYELKAGKFHKHNHPLGWLKILRGVAQAFWLMLKLKPDSVVSFGGYLSFPVVVAARILKKPVLIHEQTSIYGRANKLLAPMARKIMITWPTSKKYFPRNKTVLTGLPLRNGFLQPGSKDRLFKNSLPIIYITGGKQGCHVLNKTFGRILTQLTQRYNLIHQTGFSRITKDYEKMRYLKKQLPKNKQDRYIVSPFFSPKKVGQILSQADLVVGRAGAHTIYELAFLGQPAILVPLPFSYANEQTKNAKMLKKAGMAVVLPQKELTPVKLLKTINQTYRSIKKMRQKGEEFSKQMIKNGRTRVADIIQKVTDASLAR